MARTSKVSAEEAILPKPLLTASITEHFTALTKAIEKLNTFHEALKREPDEDLQIFDEYVDVYRVQLSKQWQNLQSSLGLPKAGCDEDVKQCRDSNKGSSESAASDEDELNPMAIESSASASVWMNCPIPIFEQVAYVYQALESQRLEMENLYERVYELEVECGVDTRLCKGNGSDRLGMGGSSATYRV